MPEIEMPKEVSDRLYPLRTPAVGETKQSFEARIAREETEIPLSENPRPATQEPTQVLEELQAQLAERNLPAAEVEELIENPELYLMRRTGDAYAAQQIVQAVASLYFKTLHLKATEGEAFTKARLGQAMVEAQTRTLEAIANTVQGCQDLNLILRTAEMLTKD